MYAIIDATTKKISKNYAVVDGATRQVTKIYGVVDGITRLIWSKNEAAYCGVVYNVRGSNDTSSYLKCNLWDTSAASFNNTATSLLSSSLSAGANYRTGFYISKNGKTVIGLESYSTTSTTLRVYAYNKDNSKYETCAILDIYKFMKGSYTGTPNIYINRSIYVSNDGTKMLVPIYCSCGGNYCESKDLFTSPGSSQQLLFYNINTDSKTVSFSKGINIFVSSYVDAGSMTKGYSGWSDTVNNLIFISGSYNGGSYTTYAYKVDLKTETVKQLKYWSDSYANIVSNDGQYCQIYDTSSGTNSLYYLNNNSYTLLSSSTISIPLPSNYQSQNAFIPENNPHVMYVNNGNYIYSYAIDGESITSLGSIYTYSTIGSSATIYDIDTANGNTLLNGSNSMILASMATTTAGNITSITKNKTFGYNYVSNAYAYNCARFIDKENMTSV